MNQKGKYTFRLGNTTMGSKVLVVISSSRLNRKSKAVVWNKTTSLNKSIIGESEGLFQAASQTLQAQLVIIKIHNFNLHRLVHNLLFSGRVMCVIPKAELTLVV